MLSASRLARIVLPVPDVAAAAEFYEGRLGLSRAGEARLLAGGVELWLRPGEGAAGPCDLVFLADDLTGACQALRDRGVPPGTPHRQPFGTFVSVRGPGGHRLRLFEPSAAALAGPAGPVIRDVRRVHGAGRPIRTPLLAVVVPETDRRASRELYYSGLGLALLGRSPCGEAGGAATLDAYDAGWVLLVTRHGPVPDRAPGMAFVYEVTGADRLCARLSGRPVPVAPGMGQVVRSADPFAPAVYLCEDCTPEPGEPALPAVCW
ncbi:VOC family protein [Nucisporomicrobium flavum]|uniref:VOC family protein n=1 Tax=Nucisporomicrobium flavum TaxID=2785915 RepID=UPI0018F2A56A|nr:VOC family protein [Nucisporomicrobium flavum]